MPKTFKDTAGRTWTVAANVATLRAVRDATGVNLADFLSLPENHRRLLTDDVFVGEVAYHMGRLEGGVPKPAFDQFGEAVYGDVIAAACDAVCEALVDFFRRPAQREALRRVNEAERRSPTDSTPAGSTPGSSASTPGN